MESVVLACFYRHNFLRRNSVSRDTYTPTGSFVSYDGDEHVIEESWRREIILESHLIDLYNTL